VVGFSSAGIGRRSHRRLRPVRRGAVLHFATQAGDHQRYTRSLEDQEQRHEKCEDNDCTNNKTNYECFQRTHRPDPSKSMFVDTGMLHCTEELERDMVLGQGKPGRIAAA